MQEFRFSFWEKLSLILSGVIVLLSLIVYLSDYPIRSLFLGDLGEEARVRVGEVVEKDGALRSQGTGQVGFSSSNVSDTLYNLDTIVTGPESRARLKFDHEASAELGPNTMVKLNFVSKLSLDGISRVPQLMVVSGKVKAAAGKQELVIKSREGTLTVKANAVEETIVPEAPPPPRIIPLASPSPTPSASGASFSEHASKIRLVFPEKGAKLSLAPMTSPPIVKVKLSWKMSPVGAKTQLTLWKVGPAQSQEGKPELTQILQELVPSDSEEVVYEWAANAPGAYQWQIRGENGQEISYPSNTEASFEIKPVYQGIRLGKIEFSPRAGAFDAPIDDENLLTQSDVTLAWDPLADQKSYVVSFFDSQDSSQPLFQRAAEAPSLKLEKDLNRKGPIFYRLSAKTPNGFVAISEVQQVLFKMPIPTLVSPKAGFEQSLKGSKDQTVLLTWKQDSYAASYRVEIAWDAEFNQMVRSDQTKNNYLVFPVKKPGHYWWRVKSLNKNYTSESSAHFDFVAIKD